MARFNVRFRFEGGSDKQRNFAEQWFTKIFSPFQIISASEGIYECDLTAPKNHLECAKSDGEVLYQSRLPCAARILVKRCGDQVCFHYRLPEGGGLNSYLTKAEEITSNYAVTNLSKHIWIHAGCLIRGDTIVILVGASGYGKTTLSLGLLKKGFLLVSDDIMLINLLSEQIIPYPRCPRIRGTALSNLMLIDLDLCCRAELIGRYVVLPLTWFHLRPKKIDGNRIHFFFLTKDIPAVSITLVRISLSQAIIMLAKRSNILIQDPELMLIEKTLSEALCYRLNVGDYSNDITQILAAVE